MFARAPLRRDKRAGAPPPHPEALVFDAFAFDLYWDELREDILSLRRHKHKRRLSIRSLGWHGPPSLFASARVVDLGARAAKERITPTATNVPAPASNRQEHVCRSDGTATPAHAERRAWRLRIHTPCSSNRSSLDPAYRLATVMLADRSGYRTLVEVSQG